MLNNRLDTFLGDFMIPALSGVQMIVYLLALSVLVKESQGPFFTAILVIEILLFFIVFYVLKIIWTLEESAAGLIQRCKGTSNRLGRMEIARFLRVVLHFGLFGRLNRDIFLFLCDFIMSKTLTSLLL
jgi:hypothetical protein